MGKTIHVFQKEYKITPSEPPIIVAKSSEENVATGCESPSSVNTIPVVASGNTEDDAINSNVKSGSSSVCSGERIRVSEDIASLVSSSSVQQGVIPITQSSKNLDVFSSDGKHLN